MTLMQESHRSLLRLLSSFERLQFDLGKVSLNRHSRETRTSILSMMIVSKRSIEHEFDLHLSATLQCNGTLLMTMVKLRDAGNFSSQLENRGKGVSLLFQRSF
jgi:hypothetical protein